MYMHGQLKELSFDGSYYIFVKSCYCFVPVLSIHYTNNKNSAISVVKITQDLYSQFDSMSQIILEVVIISS